MSGMGTAGAASPAEPSAASPLVAPAAEASGEPPQRLIRRIDPDERPRADRPPEVEGHRRDRGGRRDAEITRCGPAAHDGSFG